MAANLQEIRTKVRRLTRAPSNDELTNDEIDDYVNTFVLYDFPEHLRLFDFHTTFRFVCNPNQDVYLTTNNDNGQTVWPATTDPLYNFKNNYITVNPPIYVDGYRVFYSQSQSDFLAQYPAVDFIQNLSAGNGTASIPSQTLTNSPIAQNSVMISAVSINNTSLTLVDVPDLTTTEFGVLRTPGDNTDRGLINYLTGQITAITFPENVPSGNTITAHYYAYVAGRPLAMYYYTQTRRYMDQITNATLEVTCPAFVLRPIPDQAYTIEMQVFKRPTALMSSSAIPELEQYWQYLAYGAAKKVFEDRMDLDSVQMIMPEFKKQEQLVLRRTIVQQTNQRTSTIYTQQTNMSAVWPGWGWNQF